MIMPDPPPFKLARPLLMLGLAAGTAALAFWSRRKKSAPPRVEKPINQVPRQLRVEPAQRSEERVVDVPWGT